MNNVMEFYKLCLKLKLIGDSRLMVQLIYANELALTNNKKNGYNYNIFRDVDTNLNVQSFGDFYIGKTGLKLPQFSNVRDEMYSSVAFETDGERYQYLKKLYDCLNRWSCDKKIFKDEASSPLHNNVIINDQFWFVY